MTFDAPRAKAEFSRMQILCEHHIRQAEIAQDGEVLKEFAKQLYDLKENAERARRTMPRTCPCGKVIELRHIRTCPSCGRTL